MDIQEVWLTADEVGILLGIGKRQVNINLAAEKYISRQVKAEKGGGKNGLKSEILLSSLPEAAQKRWQKEKIGQETASDSGQTGELAAKRVLLNEDMRQKSEFTKRQEGLIATLALRGKAAERDAAKHRILAAFKEWHQAKAREGRKPKRQGQFATALVMEFVVAYNKGEIDIDGQTRAVKPRIDDASLYRWMNKLKQGEHLGGKYGHRKGSGKLDTNKDMREAVVGMLANSPHVSAKTVFDFIVAKFGEEAPSKRALERWITGWKAKHAELFTANANPDEWKNKFMAAAGSASAEIVRINQRWELDSSPADVMLTDGRHSLLASIDVYTRRPRILVAKTSKAVAVASLIRGCIVAWGVPEELKMDNGQDYKSLHIQRVCTLLDIKQNFSQPFSPWEKPHIERFFRSFSHGVFELLEGFIGHNVAEREAIRARQAFSERLFKKDELVEIKLSGQQLQEFCDRWINDIYLHELHGGLGTTPFLQAQAAGGAVRHIEDERVLDMLLAEAPGRGGLYKVGKKGLRVDGGDYTAPELALYVGQDVQVLYTEKLGEVVVYGNDRPNDPLDLHAAKPGFHFICKAVCPERAGITREEVAEQAKRAKELQKQHIQAQKKQLKNASKAAGVKDAVEVILEDKRQKAAAKVVAFPKPKIAHTSPGIAAAEDALKAQDAEGWHPEDPRTIEGQLKIIDELETRPKVQRIAFGSSFERGTWIFGEFMAGRKEALTGEDIEFISQFRVNNPKSIALLDDTLNWKYLARWEEYQSHRLAIGWPGTRRPKGA